MVVLCHAELATHKRLIFQWWAGSHIIIVGYCILANIFGESGQKHNWQVLILPFHSKRYLPHTRYNTYNAGKSIPKMSFKCNSFNIGVLPQICQIADFKPVLLFPAIWYCYLCVLWEWFSLQSVLATAIFGSSLYSI